MKKLIYWIYIISLFTSAVICTIDAFNNAQYFHKVEEIEKMRPVLEKDVFQVPVTPYGDNVEISNMYQMRMFALEKGRHDGWAIFEELGETEVLILLSIFAGIVGGIIRLLIKIVDNNKIDYSLSAIFTPLLACFSGLVLYLLFSQLPSIFNKNPTPALYLLVSIAGGIFIETVFNRLKKIITNEKS